jgi:hypothetical protein
MALSSYQIQASFIWPRIARRGNIRGDGAFAILNRCNASRWTVEMYPTPVLRAARLQELRERGCGGSCMMSHDAKDIQVDEKYLDGKFREQLHR